MRNGQEEGAERRRGDSLTFLTRRATGHPLLQEISPQPDRQKPKKPPEHKGARGEQSRLLHSLDRTSQTGSVHSHRPIKCSNKSVGLPGIKK